MNPVIPLLRAARFLLGWSQAEVAAALDIKPKTIQLLEGNSYKLLPREAWVLKAYYQKSSVEFTEAADGHGEGVRWLKPACFTEHKAPDHFGGQIVRAARGLANLSQRELAKVADVDPSFIARLEKRKFSALNEATFRKLSLGLQAKNVELTPESSIHGAGVRWIVHHPYQPLDVPKG